MYTPSRNQTTLAIAAGGTGGHLFPGISVAKAWLKRHPSASVLFFCDKNALSHLQGRDPRIRFSLVDFKGLMGRGVQGIAESLLKGPGATLNALRELRRSRPCALVCFGGFVSFPVGVAASIVGVPLFLHEGNAFPGVVNRVLRYRATCLFLAHEELANRWGKKAVLVGIPVREAIEAIEARKDDKKETRVHILVIGGSQGAYRLNRIVLESLEPLFSRLDAEVILQWGKWPIQGIEPYAQRFKERLWVVPFIEDMAWAYGWADVIISRAGASSLAELALAGKPAVLVPFPFASHDHQVYNAKSVQRAGAAVVIEEKGLTPQVLVDALVGIVKDPRVRKSMHHAWRALAKPKAAERMIDRIEALIKGEKYHVSAEPDVILPGNRRDWDERDRGASLEP